MAEEQAQATPWYVAYEQTHRVEHGGLTEIAEASTWHKNEPCTLRVTRLVGEEMRVEYHPEHHGLEFETIVHARAYADAKGLLRSVDVFRDRFADEDRERTGEYLTRLAFGEPVEDDES